MKYINAGKLCEDLMTRWKIADEKKEKEIQSIMADIVVPIVVGQPSADVVEAVRCKDCKYYKKIFYGYCEKCSTLEHTEYVNPTDFCSRGERKETE